MADSDSGVGFETGMNSFGIEFESWFFIENEWVTAKQVPAQFAVWAQENNALRQSSDEGGDDDTEVGGGGRTGSGGNPSHSHTIPTHTHGRQPHTHGLPIRFTPWVRVNDALAPETE